MPLPVWAIPAAMTAVSAGMSLFGRKKKQDVSDPLAGIRGQLQALAGQVPALVARQKELIGQRFAEAKREGIQDIGEDVYAGRGLGRTSIYDRLRTELVDKLAKSQAEAELSAEFGGLQQQASILGGTAGMYPTAQPAEEGPSTLSKILGAGTSLLAQNWLEEQSMKRLGKILGQGETGITPTTGRSFFTPETWADILASKRGSSILLA
ncbi:MAG: hypothetical protein FJW63_01865 [Actinobacteria bacterium]|nr:hypothetical protein [Actinomycetota bacterium]